MIKIRMPLTVALAACLCLVLIFPGDVPWINDEPLLIKRAFEANGRNNLAKEGLQGSVGIRYGPLPTWFYQLLLLISKNPIRLSMIKHALSLALLVGGLLFFSYRLRITPWPMFLVLLSPYIYFYNRLLWDNVFMIPISLMLWCSILIFWQGGSRWSLALVITLMVILLQIHMMAILIITPLCLTVIIYDRSWLRSHPYFTMFCCGAAVLACLPYLLSLSHVVAFDKAFRDSLPSSILSSLMGAGYFSFLHYGEYFLPEIYGQNFFLPGFLSRVLVSLSALIYLPYLLGAIHGTWTLLKKLKRGRDWSPEDRVLTLSLITVALNTAFFAVIRHHHHPHYLNALWFAYFYIIWHGLETGMRAASRWFKGIFVTQAAVMATMMIMMIGFIHINGGNQGIHYGPVLSSQIGVVQTILRYSPQSKIYNSVPNYHYFPHAYYTLKQLFQSDSSGPDLPVRHIYIVPDQDPQKGRIYAKVLEQPVSTKVQPNPDKP